jgi:hypothetical protein
MTASKQVRPLDLDPNIRFAHDPSENERPDFAIVLAFPHASRRQIDT